MLHTFPIFREPFSNTVRQLFQPVHTPIFRFLVSHAALVVILELLLNFLIAMAVAVRSVNLQSLGYWPARSSQMSVKEPAAHLGSCDCGSGAPLCRQRSRSLAAVVGRSVGDICRSGSQAWCGKVGASEPTAVDRDNNAVDEVVGTVVSGIEMRFKIIAEETGEKLIESGAELATELVDKMISSAPRLAVDKFNQDKALREGVTFQILTIIVEEFFLSLFDSRRTFTLGQRSYLLFEDIEATFALASVGKHQFDIADKLLVVTQFAVGKQGTRTGDVHLIEIDEWDSVAIDDSGKTIMLACRRCRLLRFQRIHKDQQEESDKEQTEIGVCIDHSHTIV